MPVYGMTTGLGAHKRHRVERARQGDWSRELIESHRVGHGPDGARRTSCARAMLRLLNGFAKGTVGVRPLLAERLVEALNRGDDPARAPARLGRAWPTSRRSATSPPTLFADVELAPKEALALVNNNSFSTGCAALALADAARAGRLDDGRRGARPRGVRREPHDARPRGRGRAPRTPACATSWRRCAARSTAATCGQPGAARNLQDPLSLPRRRAGARCARATRSRSRRGQLAVELNAHHDNPLVLDRRGPHRVGRRATTSCRSPQALDSRADRARAGADRRGRARAEAAAGPALRPSGRPLRAGGPRRTAGSGRSRGRRMALDRRGAAARAAGVVRARRARPRKRGSATGSRWPRWPRAGSRSRSRLGAADRRDLPALCSAQALDLRRAPALGAVTGRVRALVRRARPVRRAGSAVPDAISSRSWSSSAQAPSPGSAPSKPGLGGEGSSGSPGRRRIVPSMMS